MFIKASFKGKMAYIPIIVAFTVGLSGNWIYETFDIDPTYTLPIIACIPAWKIVVQQRIEGLITILVGYAVVTFIYTCALCIPAGVGLIVINAVSG